MNPRATHTLKVIPVFRMVMPSIRIRLLEKNNRTV